MLRIAHISDLHIKDPSINSDESSVLQRMVQVLAASKGFSVEAGGHSEDTRAALVNALGLLKPDVIVITGDITNFGDRKSFELASGYVRELRESAQARKVICVPGNHDTLVERAREIKSRRLARAVLWVASQIDRTADVVSSTNDDHFGPEVKRKIKDAKGLVLLGNFNEWLEGEKFDAVDPGRPVYVHAGWGEVAFFLFNSTNDPGLMANKGRIGSPQFNVLNTCLQGGESREKCLRAVRFALLHHHPISAPQSRDADYNRAYDWMNDGPLFLQYVNRHGFHFVLHGHQHEPFQCTVNYAESKGNGLHIVAAGSAMQEGGDASFNIIDLLTPFEARLRRYDYGPTGFDERPKLDIPLPLRPVDEVRVTPIGEPERVDDWAMRQLVAGADSDAYDLDAAHAYDELEYSVELTESHLYKGVYRRKGRVIGTEPSGGPVFSITGSPAMKVRAMNLRAWDSESKEELGFDVMVNDPNRKVIRVTPPLELKAGDAFDVTLSFEWQATESEDNDFDGFNLMYFHRPKDEHGTEYVAERLKYSVLLPWKPAQARVRAYGVTDSRPDMSKEPEIEDVPPPAAGGKTGYRLSFEIDKPKPLAYLVYFAPQEKLDS